MARTRNSGQQERATARLYVGNLSFETTADSVRDALQEFGIVSDVQLAVDHLGRSRGFAFVTMSSPEEARTAIAGMIDRSLDGRPLRVNKLDAATQLESKAWAMPFPDLARTLREYLRTRAIKRAVALRLIGILETKVTAPDEETHRRIVQNLRRDWTTMVPASLASLTNAERLPWVLLPKGNATDRVQRLLASLDEYKRRNPGVKIDQDRIRYACSLRPNEIYVGQEHFDGYVVFVFSRTSRVLLEHPVYGNAAFVFIKNWKFLSSLSKSELMQRNDSIRIIHSQNWKEDVKRALEAR